MQHVATKATPMGMVSVLILVLLSCAVIPASAQTPGTTPAPQTGIIFSDRENIFDSPFYNDSDSFVSAKSTALAAAILSGLAGNPVMAAHVARSTTLLSVCKPIRTGPLPLSQLPVIVPMGNHEDTQYYAGAALMNPVCLIGAVIALFTLSHIACSALGYRRSRALSVGRFPSTSAFPLAFLIHPSTQCAVTVLFLSDDLAMSIPAGFMIVFWLGVVAAVVFWIWKKVPQECVYVENFRQRNSDHAFSQGRLREMVETFNAERLADLRMREDRIRMQQEREEAEDRNREDPYAEERDKRAAAEAEMDEVIGKKPGLLSRFASVVSKGDDGQNKKKKRADAAANNELIDELLAKEYSNTVAGTGMKKVSEGEATEVRDETNRRMKQTAMVAYAQVLSAALENLDFDDQGGSLIHFLQGEHRWEDEMPDDEELEREERESIERQSHLDGMSENERLDAEEFEQREADLKTNLRKNGVYSGWVLMYGLFFNSYREEQRWFFGWELIMSMCCAFIEGWRPTTGESKECYGQVILLFFLMGVYLASQVYFHPYISTFNQQFVTTVALVQFAGSLFVLISITDNDDSAVLATYVIAVLCVYLLVLKSLMDAYRAIAAVLMDEEEPWTTTLEVTKTYFNPPSELTVAGATQRKRLNELERERQRRDKERRVKEEKHQKLLEIVAEGNDASSLYDPLEAQLLSGSDVASFRASRKGGVGAASETSSNAGGMSASFAGSPTNRSVKGLDARSAHTDETEGTMHGKSIYDYIEVVNPVEEERRRFANIGGRRNAFVSSRGVPEILHPFAQVPLPDPPLLPPRRVRRVAKTTVRKQKEKKKGLWSRVRHLFAAKRKFQLMGSKKASHEEDMPEEEMMERANQEIEQMQRIREETNRSDDEDDDLAAAPSDPKDWKGFMQQVRAGYIPEDKLLRRLQRLRRRVAETTAQRERLQAMQIDTSGPEFHSNEDEAEIKFLEDRIKQIQQASMNEDELHRDLVLFGGRGPAAEQAASLSRVGSGSVLSSEDPASPNVDPLGREFGNQSFGPGSFAVNSPNMWNKSFGQMGDNNASLVASGMDHSSFFRPLMELYSKGQTDDPVVNNSIGDLRKFMGSEMSEAEAGSFFQRMAELHSAPNASFAPGMSPVNNESMASPPRAVREKHSHAASTMNMSEKDPFGDEDGMDDDDPLFGNSSPGGAGSPDAQAPAADATRSSSSGSSAEKNPMSPSSQRDGSSNGSAGELPLERTNTASPGRPGSIRRGLSAAKALGAMRRGRERGQQAAQDAQRQLEEARGYASPTKPAAASMSNFSFAANTSASVLSGGPPGGTTGSVFAAAVGSSPYAAGGGPQQQQQQQPVGRNGSPRGTPQPTPKLTPQDARLTKILDDDFL